VANKWSAMVIGLLEGGPARFGELRSQMAGVSPKMLTRTLRQPRLQSSRRTNHRSAGR
jgi:DNA-binding HxlR family transcriptional regulator